MLSWKTRLALVVVVFGVAAGGALINQIGIEVEGTAGDINQKDIYFFERAYWATFRYENGTRGHADTLTLRSTPLNATHTNVTIQYAGRLEAFLAHPNGTVYQAGQLRGNYSIWWIHLPNVGMMFGVEGGEEYAVVDPTGFLEGPAAPTAGRAYQLVVDEKRTYWPSDPALRALSGAQSSIRVSLWDATTRTLTARATMDITCGIVELWEGSRAAAVRLTLVDTNFPISRNRNVVLVVDVLLGVLACLVAFGAMSVDKIKTRLPGFDRDPAERAEIVLLMGTGVAAVVLEVVDIWFYLYLGRSGMLYLHLGYMAVLAAVCWRQQYGYRWCVPAFLEVAFVFALGFVTGDPYVPSLTAFMGSTISWLGLVWASGIAKTVDADETGWGKRLSGFF